MIFVDDVVLIDEMHEGMNKKLELWRSTLELKEREESGTQIQYMHCQFHEVWKKVVSICMV